jgi:hypothetical protein
MFEKTARLAFAATTFMAVSGKASPDVDETSLALLDGQLQPHREARFVSVDMSRALAARHERGALVAKLREAFGVGTHLPRKFPACRDLAGNFRKKGPSGAVFKPNFPCVFSALHAEFPTRRSREFS